MRIHPCNSVEFPLANEFIVLQNVHFLFINVAIDYIHRGFTTKIAVTGNFHILSFLITLLEDML